MTCWHTVINRLGGTTLYIFWWHKLITLTCGTNLSVCFVGTKWQVWSNSSPRRVSLLPVHPPLPGRDVDYFLWWRKIMHQRRKSWLRTVSLQTLPARGSAWFRCRRMHRCQTGHTAAVLGNKCSRWQLQICTNWEHYLEHTKYKYFFSIIFKKKMDLYFLE